MFGQYHAAPDKSLTNESYGFKKTDRIFNL